ncbi:MAG TPA: hypothetical protein VLG67_00830 [Candidatus Saccharimonadales bacterium]|nr:hypothetical protein [Candidatus Saccharimonadales bacterium]
MKKYNNKLKIKNTLYLTVTFGAIFFTLNTNIVFAVSATPTPPKAITPTISETLNEKLNSQINQLKDKIASRVSELNLVEKKGVTGVVSDTSTNKITLTDISGYSNIIDIDEITKFSSSSAKGTFGLSDLTKGTNINVLGLYNKQSKRILARFITTAINPSFLSGTISDIDGKGFTITIISSDKKSTKIDINTATKISIYSKIDGLTKIGFTKLNIGERVSIVGFPDKTTPSLIVASRIVDLPSLPKDPNISIAEPTPTTVPTTKTTTLQTATTSAKKISPTISR